MVCRFNILRLFCFIVLVSVFNSLKAEGTKQLAPNKTILIAGSETHDIASLHINSPSYNNFASRKNKNPESRLYVHILDPTTECIFLGFSEAHLMNAGPFQDIEYWVLDPNGKEVFGGVKVFEGDAEIKNWQEAVNGPQQLVGEDGYTATYISSEDLTSQGWTGPGDYYIEFKNRSSGFPFLLDYFDITVASCGPLDFEERPGRVWAYNWAIFSINDFGFPNRPFNGSFYICAPDTYNESKSFVTKIDFNGSGFQPGAFNFAFNSFGADTTGNITFDRKSVENRNRTLWEYPIYLKDPVDICDEAIVGDAKIKSIRRCDNNGFEFGVYIKGHSQVEFLLDFYKVDGIYTENSEDIVIAQDFKFSGVDTLVHLYWDGYDGLGNNYNNLLEGEIPAKMLYGQAPFHFPIFDGEYLFNGLNVEQVRPRTFNPILLFYDDSNISEDPGISIVKEELVGCESPCHSWNNYLSPNSIGFGNRNTINTWWFGNQIQEEVVFEIPSYYICKVVGPSNLCNNDTINLFARPQLTPLAGEPYPITEVTWTGPNIIGNNNSKFIKIDGGGEYMAELFWVNDDDVECSTICSFMVEDLPFYEVVIDTLITLGDIVEFNRQEYSDNGSYVQNLTAKNGCDSILTINVEVFIPDVFLNCELQGAKEICANETSTISSSLSQSILSDFPVGIISSDWEGPDIIENNTNYIEVGTFGVYTLNVTSLDLNNNTLTTECQFQIDELPIYNEVINVEMFSGETFTLNNVVYTEAGPYVDSLLTVNNCDSIIDIVVRIKKLPIVDQFVLFDMSDCQSSDYNRLIAEYNTFDNCLLLDVTNLYRENPEVNAHSCTSGIGDGSAICVSSDDSSTYYENSDKHLRFKIKITPEEGRTVKITQFSFFEKSPEYFSWTAGGEGLNNFPNKLAVSIKVNDSIIYSLIDQTSTRDWKFRSFDFVGNDNFVFTEKTEIEFSMLAYDLIGNSSPVTAWDVDEVQVVYSCESDTTIGTIQGFVTDVFDEPIEEVMVQLFDVSGIKIQDTYTNQSGEYAFDNLSSEIEYIINAKYDVDPLLNITTLDLLLIQRHILGLQHFTKPYQFIAADINFDKNISTLDLVELRKIILGISDNFKDDKSWLFIDGTSKLELDNLWKYESSMQVDLNKRDLDLKGIKIGDVNSQMLTNRSHSIANVISKFEPSKYVNEQFEIVLSLEELNKYDGFQFEIGIKEFDIVDIEILNENVMYHHHKSRKYLTMSYLASERLNVQDEFAKLTVKNKVRYNQNNIEFVNDIIEAEAYIENTAFSLNLIVDTSEKFNNLVISPNPFGDELYLNFESDIELDANVTIYNLNGERVCQMKSHLYEGKNTMEIHSNCDVQKLSGVYIVQFKYGKNVIQDKILSY